MLNHILVVSCCHAPVSRSMWVSSPKCKPHVTTVVSAQLDRLKRQTGEKASHGQAIEDTLKAGAPRSALQSGDFTACGLRLHRHVCAVASTIICLKLSGQLYHAQHTVSIALQTMMPLMIISRWLFSLGAPCL